MKRSFARGFFRKEEEMYIVTFVTIPYGRSLEAQLPEISNHFVKATSYGGLDAEIKRLFDEIGEVSRLVISTSVSKI